MVRFDEPDHVAVFAHLHAGKSISFISYKGGVMQKYTTPPAFGLPKAYLDAFNSWGLQKRFIMISG